MSGQCRSAAEAEKGEEILRLGALVGQDLDGRLGAIRSGGAGSGSGSSCRRCCCAVGEARGAAGRTLALGELSLSLDLRSANGR